MILLYRLISRFNVDCSEAESFYNINDKLGSDEPIATEEGSLSSSRNRPQQNQPKTQSQKPQGNQPRTQPQKPQQNDPAPRKRPQQRRKNKPKKKPQEPKRPLGVSSSSILGQNEIEDSQIEFDLVEYDATLPGDDEENDVPVLFADPFRDIEEPPLSLYGAPPRRG